MDKIDKKMKVLEILIVFCEIWQRFPTRVVGEIVMSDAVAPSTATLSPRLSRSMRAICCSVL